MSNIYRTNFEKIRESYQQIFDALERALIKFDVDFYLIGAQSRDVWTNHLNLTKRTTRDIDYCVYVKNRDVWNQLTAYLQNNEGFKRDEKEPYRFYLDGIVDLVPFGGIEENNEVVLYNPTTELSVYGFREVTEDAIVEGSFKIITIAGLCILKLIAYSDKPDRRAKDLDDFLFLMNNYHEIAGEELFMGKHDDLIEGNFEIELAAARMLGRNMKLTLKENTELEQKIIAILKHQLQGFNADEIDQMYKFRDTEELLIIKFKRILETIKGIED